MDFITPSHHYFSRPKCFLSSNNNNEECTSQSFTSCVEFKQDLLLDWVCLKCIKIQFIKVNGKRAVTFDIFSIFKRRTAIRKWQFNTKFPQAIFVECPLMEFVLRRIKIHLCICNIWVVSVYKIVLNLLINKRRHRLSKYSNRIQMSTKIVICFPNNIETNLPPYIAVYSFVELLVQQSCSHICKLPTSTAVLQKNRNIGPIYRKNQNGQTVIIPVRPSVDARRSASPPVGDGEHGAIHDALSVPTLWRAGQHHDHALRAVSRLGADQAETDGEGARARRYVGRRLFRSDCWFLASLSQQGTGNIEVGVHGINSIESTPVWICATVWILTLLLDRCDR